MHTLSAVPTESMVLAVTQIVELHR